MSTTSITKVAAATHKAPRLPAMEAMYLKPTTFLDMRDFWCTLFTMARLLHYVYAGGPTYRHYMQLSEDAPDPVKPDRLTFDNYGVNDVVYTNAQLKYLGNEFAVLDEYKLALLDTIDPSVLDHLRTFLNPESCELDEFFQVLDQEFLNAGLRHISILYDEFKLAKGITSLSALIKQVRYLRVLQVLSTRPEDPVLVVNLISECLNMLQLNDMVLRYHEVRGLTPEDPAHYIEFLKTRIQLMSYKKLPAITVGSGLLHPVLASPAVPISGLADQVSSLSAQLTQLTALVATMTAAPAAPAAKFCSTHGMGKHASAQCEHRSPGHNLTDTAVSWSNKAQHLATAAARRARKPNA